VSPKYRIASSQPAAASSQITLIGSYAAAGSSAFQYQLQHVATLRPVSRPAGEQAAPVGQITAPVARRRGATRKKSCVC
jgi:hypothetical protein